MTIRSIAATAIAAFAIALTATPASAGLIADRAQLNAQLGAWAFTEDFESWTSDQITPSGFDQLDAATVVGGQGPGIVNPGLRWRARVHQFPPRRSGAHHGLQPRRRAAVAAEDL